MGMAILREQIRPWKWGRINNTHRKGAWGDKNYKSTMPVLPCVLQEPRKHTTHPQKELREQCTHAAIAEMGGCCQRKRNNTANRELTRAILLRKEYSQTNWTPISKNSSWGRSGRSEMEVRGRRLRLSNQRKTAYPPPPSNGTPENIGKVYCPYCEKKHNHIGNAEVHLTGYIGSQRKRIPNKTGVEIRYDAIQRNPRVD